MLGLLLMLLVVGGLVTVIFGRKAGQGLVAGVFLVGSIGFGLLILFVAVLLMVTPSWRTQHAPDPSYYPGQSAAAPEAQPQPQSVPQAAPEPVQEAAAVRRTATLFGLEASSLSADDDLKLGLTPSADMPWPCGIVVSRVSEGAGAAVAGIRPGDDLMGVDNAGKKEWLCTEGQLRTIAAQSPAGVPVRMFILRDGKLFQAYPCTKTYFVN